MRSWIEMSDPERCRPGAKPQQLQRDGRVARGSMTRRIMELTDRRFLSRDDPLKLTQEQFEIELRKVCRN